MRQIWLLIAVSMWLGLQVPTSDAKKAKKIEFTEMMNNHLSLARILSTIDIQQRFEKKYIRARNIIAGMYNIEDRYAVTKLAEFPLDVLPVDLPKFEEERESLLRQLTNFYNDAAGANYKTSVNEDMLVQMKTSADFGNIPNTEGFELLLNLEAVTMPSIDMVQNESSKQEFLNELDAIINMLQQLPIFMKRFQHKNDLNLDVLISGATVADRVSKQLQTFGNLSDKLQNALESHTAAAFFATNETVRGDMMRLQKISKQFFDPQPYLFVCAPFQDNHDLLQIYTDRQKMWIENILNNGKSMGRIDEALRNFHNFVVKFESLDEVFEYILHLQPDETVTTLLDFIYDFRDVQNHSAVMRNLSTCFDASKLSDRSSVDSLLNFNADKKQLAEFAANFLNTFDSKLKSLNELSQQLRTLKSTANIDYDELKGFLNRVKPIFDETKLTEGTQSARKLARNMFNALQDIEKNIKPWIKHVVEASKNCSNLFNFDATSNPALETIQRELTTIKETNATGKLLEVFGLMPEYVNKLEQVDKFNLTQFKAHFYRIKRSFRIPRIMQDVDYPRDILMQTTNAIWTMAQIGKMGSFQNELFVIWRESDKIMDLIKDVKNPRHRNELEKHWTDPKVFGLQLDDLCDRINEATQLMRTKDAFTEEESLKEIGAKYARVASVLFLNDSSFNLDLSGKIRSLRFLDQKNQNVQNMKRALTLLKPMFSVDYLGAPKRFEKMPQYMEDIQGAFDGFFEEVDLSPPPHVPMVRKQKKKIFYKIIEDPWERKVFCFIGGCLMLVQLAIFLLIVRFCCGIPFFWEESPEEIQQKAEEARKNAEEARKKAEKDEKRAKGPEGKKREVIVISKQGGALQRLRRRHNCARPV